MAAFWNFLVAHWGYISAAILLVLKWSYNSWTQGVTFLQFVHNFIGEVIQESPQSTIARQQEEGQQVGPAASPVAPVVHEVGHGN